MKPKTTKELATKLAGVFITSALSGQASAGSVAVCPTTDAISVEVQPPAKSGEAAGDANFLVTIPDKAIPFGDKEQREFRSLAAKRALGTASPEDEARFVELQNARRNAPENQATDEIFAEYQRRQMILEAKSFLQRHVRFIKS